MLLENSNFRNIFVKNVQIPTNQLHDAAKSVKEQLIEVLKSLNEKKSSEASELAHDLIKNLFGPNSFTHFSAKKN
jgi:hypothetical protein